MIRQEREISREQMLAQNESKDAEPSLKGTLVSVFLVGAFIVVTWTAAFMLFVSRQ